MTFRVHSRHIELLLQGCQEPEVNCQHQIFVSFRTISGLFCGYQEANDTENAGFSEVTNLNQSSRSVL